MLKALVLAPFDAGSLESLRSRVEVIYESWMETRKLLAPEELLERIEKENIAILVIEADFVFEDVFDNTEKLRLIGVCRNAVDHVDIEAATRHGVLIVNTPARNAVSVAELTIGLMLSLARRIPQADKLVRSGEWDDPVGPYISLRGMELADKVVGIIGFGAVGAEVAKRLKAFDMQVLVYDPYVESEKVSRVGAEKVDLPRLMGESDFITLHCTASTRTAGLVGSNEISLMKSTASIINTAGWDIVDEEALLDALQTRRIAGAAFDIYQTHPVPSDSPLLKLENVVLTPHIGGATNGTVKRYSRMIVDDVERFLDGRRPLNLVNPQAWKKNA